MSLITISNSTFTVTLDSCGAVLHSLVRDGNEYLWQGNPTYWKRRDAQLFPYVGRLTEGKYLLHGKAYELPTHGFCIGREFAVESQSEDAVTFRLDDNEETYAMYPFHFTFRVVYTLENDTVVKTCRVENRDENEMYFGIGGHPGFQVPVAGEGSFTDWQLVFSRECLPTRVDFDPENYRLAGTTSAFPLEDGKTLPLTHELFDLDAVVLTDIPDTITIQSPVSGHSVRVSYPGVGFVGLWHAPKTDAPYVCIEPWLSLPSHSAYVEDLQTQAHLAHLPGGESFERVTTITVK